MSTDGRKKISLAQRGEAIVLEYRPFLKVQSYTFDADFLKNKERVIDGVLGSDAAWGQDKAYSRKCSQKYRDNFRLRQHFLILP